MRRNKNTRNRRRTAPTMRVPNEMEAEESGAAEYILQRLHERTVRRPVRLEVLKQYQIAAGIAVAFVGRTSHTIAPQQLNSLREQIFIVLENSENSSARTKALAKLGWLVNDIWSEQIASALRTLRDVCAFDHRDRIA